MTINDTKENIISAGRLRGDKLLKMTAKQRRSATKGFEPEEYDANVDCPVPYIACVCRGVPIPKKITDEGAGFRMRCTNDRCLLAASFFLHKKCSDKLEENLLKILANEGSARGWTDAQLRSNLWEKKGQSLVGRILRCRCGMGVMSVDVDFYKKQMVEERKQKTFADPKVVQAKKAARKSKLPAVNYNNVRPVPVELLANDFLPTKASEHSPQYLNGRSLEKDSPSSTITPSPTPPHEQQQQRLFSSGGSEKHNDDHRKKKSYGNPKSAQSKKSSRKCRLPIINNNNVRPIQKDLIQNEFISNGASEHSPSSNNYLSNKSAERDTPCINSKPPITPSQTPPTAPIQNDQQQQNLCGNNNINGAGDIQPRRFYSLFDPDSRGFYLGEQILGEFYLPRLLQPSI